MSKVVYCVAGLTLVVCTVGVCAEVALDPGPGYINFSEIGILGDTEPTVKVSLVKPLLRLVSVVASVADPEIGEVLSVIDHLQVRVYEDAGDAASESRESVETFMEKLQADGWYPTVQVSEEKEKVNVFTQTDGENISGLVVLVVSDKEVVFVNASCHINPETTGELLVSIVKKIQSGELDLKNFGKQFSGKGKHKEEAIEGKAKQIGKAKHSLGDSNSEADAANAVLVETDES